MMKLPNIRRAVRANNFTPQTTHSTFTNIRMPILVSSIRERIHIAMWVGVHGRKDGDPSRARPASRLTQVWSVPRKKTFSVIYSRSQALRGGQRHQLAVNVLRVVDFARRSKHVLCVLQSEGQTDVWGWGWNEPRNLATGPLTT